MWDRRSEREIETVAASPEAMLVWFSNGVTVIGTERSVYRSSLFGSIGQPRCGLWATLSTCSRIRHLL